MSEPKSRDLPATAPPHLRGHLRSRNGLPPLPEVRGAPRGPAPMEVPALGSSPVTQRPPLPALPTAGPARPHVVPANASNAPAPNVLPFVKPQGQPTAPMTTAPMTLPPEAFRPPAAPAARISTVPPTAYPAPAIVPTAPDPAWMARPATARPLSARLASVPPAAMFPAAAAPASRWAVFEKLGLGPTATPKKNTQKFLVSAYRALGFAILSIIVFVLIGYIATSAFYYWNSSWVQPMVVSRTDEKVLTLQAQVATQENARDRIAAELAHADRYIAVQQAFQAEFAAAIRADLEGRKNALGRARKLATSYAGARKRIEGSNRAYASASAMRMAQEYKAGLIDRSDMLSGKYQLAQITTSNLSLAERESEFATRAADLEKEATALDAILGAKGGDQVLSYDVLRIKQEYEMSRLETAKAIAGREALRASAAREENILAGLKQSPYLRAIDDKVTVAFVPYGNLDGIEAGTPLYGCSLEMVWCHEVGKVMRVLPGEVSFKHPRREKTLRGQMIEVDLEGATAAEKDVLFVGGKPLGI